MCVPTDPIHRSIDRDMDLPRGSCRSHPGFLESHRQIDWLRQRPRSTRRSSDGAGCVTVSTSPAQSSRTVAPSRNALMATVAAPSPHPIYLAGRWVESDQVLDVINPATDELAGRTF